MADLPPNLKNVLELGTGEGMWVKQMGGDYPSTKLKALDLKEPPDVSSFPPNVQYVQGDMEVGGPSAPFVPSAPKFDYIHAALLIAFIKNWQQLDVRI